MGLRVEGGVSGGLVDVDPTLDAMRVAPYAPEGEFYTVRATSGILAATLAADAPVWGIRHGAGAAKHAYIHKIEVGFGCTVAFTTGSQFGAYLERFSVANLAGGGTHSPLKFDTNDSSEISEMRVATTAALTVVGVTFDGFKVPILSGPSPLLGQVIGPFTAFDASESAPIRLRPGEGMSMRNLIVWPAAGTGIFYSRVTWRES